MEVRIASSWKKHLQAEFNKPYFAELAKFVKEEYRTQTIYPPGKLIFNAFEQCDFNDLKVVILGQDPYHGPGQAHGLCFSVREGISFPPSLRNIYKEIGSEFSIPFPDSGDLTPLAKQGVLLLNATLTVRAGQAGSHQGRGWEIFTDAVIRIVSKKKERVVFMLWGSYARKKKALIATSKHLVLESPHPSPLSAHRGFFGNGHFSKANDYLEESGKRGIRYSLGNT
jgi:uracil-DNA glycosylase